MLLNGVFHRDCLFLVRDDMARREREEIDVCGTISDIRVCC